MSSPLTSDCGRQDAHAPHTETGTMLGAYYSHNCHGLQPKPRPDYVLRLTGEQIGSIEPPPEGDWFTDWDEYEDFVPRRMLEAEAALPVPALDPLREAAQAMVTLTDDLARWDELNGYVINSERDWLAANLSAAWEQLRAALREGETP